MTQIQIFVFAVMTLLWNGDAFAQPAEDQAIQSACPEREAFGSRISAGYKYDIQRGYITRCLSAEEGRAAVAEEQAIHVACPEREAFGTRITTGYKYDIQGGYLTRCKSADEGRAAIAEEQAIHAACPKREAFGSRIGTGYKFDIQQGYITRCLSAEEGRAAVAEEQAIHAACPEREAFGRKISVGYKYDIQRGYITRCLSVIESEPTEQPVAQAKPTVAEPEKSASAKPRETDSQETTRQQTEPNLARQSLQKRIEVSEKIINDLAVGGMQQAAKEKLAQAKRELQAGKLEASQESLHEANEYALLAGKINSEWAVSISAIQSDPKHAIEKLPTYGNYGGKSYTGGYNKQQEPINNMDKLFKIHDGDYQTAEEQLNDRKLTEIEYQRKIMQADKKLLKGLNGIEKDSILGENGGLYGDLKHDLLYRDIAKSVFKEKIAISEKSLAGQQASAGSGQDIAKRVIENDGSGQAAVRRVIKGK